MFVSLPEQLVLYFPKLGVNPQFPAFFFPGKFGLLTTFPAAGNGHCIPREFLCTPNENQTEKNWDNVKNFQHFGVFFGEWHHPDFHFPLSLRAPVPGEGNVGFSWSWDQGLELGQHLDCSKALPQAQWKILELPEIWGWNFGGF